MNVLNRNQKIFLVCCALIGFVFVMLVTFQYGAGVSSDGVRNLSTADNVAKGNGFFDMTGGAFTWWPPLYPLVLAGISFITRGDVLLAAWWLNALLMPVNIFLWGRLFFYIFQGKPIYAVLALAMTLFSRSSLRLYDNVFSEPLFIMFSLFFMFLAADYLLHGKRNNLWWMFLLGALAVLQRYVGVILIGMAGLIGLMKEDRQRWWILFMAGIASLLPVMSWVYFHNYSGYGMWFGPRVPQTMIPSENISLMLTKSLNWFMPLHPLLKPFMLQPWTILLPMLIILLLLNRKNNWKAWFQTMVQDPYVWPILLFTLLHTFVLTFTVNTVDHRDLTSDRYYVTTMPALLIFIFLTFDTLVLSHLNSKNKTVKWALLALFGFWFIYPLFSMQEYIRDGIAEGEPSNYNIYNKKYGNEMNLVRVAREIAAKDASIDWYSNYTSSGWFYLRRTILQPPYQNAQLEEPEQLVELKKNYADWPPNGRAYLIWFTPNEFLHYASPQHLKTVASLKLLYEDDNGQIFYIERMVSP